MKKSISVTVNGELRTVDVEPNDILLHVLRDKLGVKSPKIGCERGDCGTCTIMLNGKTVRSCLMLAIEVDGQEITTVEDLSRDELTPLQEKFIEHNSFQCGFCAPGMTLAATELLQKNQFQNVLFCQGMKRLPVHGASYRCTPSKNVSSAIP